MSDSRTRDETVALRADDSLKPSAAAVRAELERILASRCFQQAVRASHFLRFVTEQTLVGGGQRLKGYTIGVEVFGRPADFDAQSDALVRVEAGRLRRRLVEYYASEGENDPIRIELPRGSYAVEYHFVNAGAAPVPAPGSRARARARRRRSAVAAHRRGAGRGAPRRHRRHHLAAGGVARSRPRARCPRRAGAHRVAAHRRRAVRESRRGWRTRRRRGEHDRGDHAAARRARSLRHREPGELVRPEPCERPRRRGRGRLPVDGQRARQRDGSANYRAAHRGRQRSTALDRRVRPGRSGPSFGPRCKSRWLATWQRLPRPTARFSKRSSHVLGVRRRRRSCGIASRPTTTIGAGSSRRSIGTRSRASKASLPGNPTLRACGPGSRCCTSTLTPLVSAAAATKRWSPRAQQPRTRWRSTATTSSRTWRSRASNSSMATRRSGTASSGRSSCARTACKRWRKAASCSPPPATPLAVCC